jgi:hypothetical protein
MGRLGKERKAAYRPLLGKKHFHHRVMNIPNGLEGDTMTKSYRNLKRK